MDFCACIAHACSTEPRPLHCSRAATPSREDIPVSRMPATINIYASVSSPAPPNLQCEIYASISPPAPSNLQCASVSSPAPPNLQCEIYASISSPAPPNLQCEIYASISSPAPPNRSMQAYPHLHHLTASVRSICNSQAYLSPIPTVLCKLVGTYMSVNVEARRA